ncbi:MAG: hypothetical protein Q9M28_11210, partial [Mariprofundaceae bacterium]|nr:hypothetical protein [Mariprofundaceae bacterium]
ELVLLVITDREDFVLDEHINIAKKFTIHAAIEADLMDLKGDAKLLTFTSMNLKKMPSPQKKIAPPKNIPQESKELQNYFKKKTHEYRHG